MRHQDQALSIRVRLQAAGSGREKFATNRANQDGEPIGCPPP